MLPNINYLLAIFSFTIINIFSNVYRIPIPVKLYLHSIFTIIRIYNSSKTNVKNKTGSA